MTLIPNAEKIVADYLREETDARVVAKTPDTTGTSWVRLTQLGAPSETSVDHLIRFMLQLDCYAGKDGGQPEAMTLSREVRDALEEMRETDFDDAVVTNSRNVGHHRQPDTGFTPDRERVILTHLVWMHA